MAVNGSPFYDPGQCFGAGHFEVKQTQDDGAWCPQLPISPFAMQSPTPSAQTNGQLGMQVQRCLVTFPSQ